MQEVIEKYYIANNGTKFEDENECKEYEEAVLKIKTIKAQIEALNKELACVEYIAYGKKQYIEPVKDAGGCGHDGYYNKCPHCGELVGGYEGRNKTFKVDEHIYKCEKCGKFFRYR